MSFPLYQLYYRKVFSVPTAGNIDGRYFDNQWSPAQVTFKARNRNEAMKKAKKFWEEGQFGMGSITVKLV